MPFIRSRVAPAAAVNSAPLAAYTLGTQVGVPTGTSLTATSGIPTQDATVTFSRTDPIDGSAITINNVKQWSARSWALTLSGSVPAAEVWWFDRCAFNVPSSFFCFDYDTPSGPNDRKSPTLIFTRCTFNGSGSTDKGLTSNRAWVEECEITVDQGSDVGGCEDGWISCVYCTVIRCNIRAGLGSNRTDPHSDGLQITDTGATAFYQTWFSGGGMTGALQGNSALRVGTEFGATAAVDVFYCGFGGGGGSTVQFRGDNGAANTPITGVRFRGCRWCDNLSAFHYDFQQDAAGGTMIAEWTDNLRGTSGTVGGVFYPAGYVMPNPGI